MTKLLVLLFILKSQTSDIDKLYINYLIQLNKEQLWYLSYDLNQDQNIMKVRTAILETLMANYSLNYDYIFMELLKDNIFLPIKNCINNYLYESTQ